MDKNFRRHKHWYSDGRVEWAVTGIYGTLSFHVTTYLLGEEVRRWGGVEAHYNETSRPSYMANKPPDYTDCHMNGGRCWHEGTSLWADEYWIPKVLHRGDEAIFEELEKHYENKLSPEQPDTED